MYPCGRWQHHYRIHSWLLEALPLVQAMVDAAYGNNRLEGICEDDSIPSTRTSNPGPGKNVKASSKKTKIRVRIPRNPISQKYQFWPCTVNRAFTWIRPARRKIVRNEIGEVLTQIFPDTRNRTEIPEKPWKSSRYSMESSSQKQEFRNAGKRPPWEKDYKLLLIMLSCCWQFRCYVDGEHSVASRSLALMAFNGFSAI